MDNAARARRRRPGPRRAKVGRERQTAAVPRAGPRREERDVQGRVHARGVARALPGRARARLGGRRRVPQDAAHRRPDAHGREPAQRHAVPRRGRRPARLLRLEPVGRPRHARHRGRVRPDPAAGVRGDLDGRVHPELSRALRPHHRRRRPRRRGRDRRDRAQGDRHEGQRAARVVRRRLVRHRARHPDGPGPARPDVPRGRDPARAAVLAPPVPRPLGRPGPDVRVAAGLSRPGARGVALARALPRGGDLVRRPRAAGDVHEVQRDHAAARLPPALRQPPRPRRQRPVPDRGRRVPDRPRPLPQRAGVPLVRRGRRAAVLRSRRRCTSSRRRRCR